MQSSYSAQRLIELTQHYLNLDGLAWGFSSHASTELVIELSKLKAFGDILGLSNTTQISFKQFSLPPFATFVQSCLEQIRAAIAASRASLSDYRLVWTVNESLAGVTKELRPVKPIADAVRPSIRSLCESVSDQENFNQLFYTHFLSHVASEGALRATEIGAEESPTVFVDTGIHAKFKRLNVALEQKTATTGSGLILNWDHVEIQSTFSRNHHLALYDDKQDHHSDPQRVFIEWIFFSQFPDGELEDSSIQRLLDLAELLHTPKPASFRALDCHGFLPPKGDDGTKGYGFVFAFPALPNSSLTTLQPRTLREMLDVRFSNWSLSLGDKFNMAKALASSQCHLHRHEWLHKNVRSNNVIFFVDENNQRLKGGPYLIGFHHGRKYEQKFCSDVPSDDSDPEALLYQHPDYKYDENRSEKDHDRYSLGIILLELAYWKPVLKMRQQEGDLPRDQFREKFLRKYVPKVAEIMGNTYREVTELCLRGGFGSKGEATETDDNSQFSLDVVQTLESCQVG